MGHKRSRSLDKEFSFPATKIDASHDLDPKHARKQKSMPPMEQIGQSSPHDQPEDSKVAAGEASQKLENIYFTDDEDELSPEPVKMYDMFDILDGYFSCMHVGVNSELSALMQHIETWKTQFSSEIDQNYHLNETTRKVGEILMENINLLKESALVWKRKIEFEQVGLESRVKKLERELGLTQTIHNKVQRQLAEVQGKNKMLEDQIKAEKQKLVDAQLKLSQGEVGEPPRYVPSPAGRVGEMQQYASLSSPPEEVPAGPSSRGD